MLELSLILYAVASLGLCAFGMHHYLLLFLFLRRRKPASAPPPAGDHPDDLPMVTTQIPLYNERHVARRVLRAVAAQDYPKARHQIQVLDDSSDATRGIVDAAAAELRAEGYTIEVLRRTNRQGYKAGALQEGLASAAGTYLAIFDADFIPPPDFLKRMLPHLMQHPRAGLVQARWGHTNADESWLTRAQSFGIDNHFLIEQSARSRHGLFLNFNGTAGIWRRAAIDDAGGWKADTLTEDLDLSYRAQLRGWTITYRPDIIVPAELPSSATAFKNQQFRWAKGSIQTALKMAPQVLRCGLPWWRKAAALLHLTSYSIHPLMLLLALLAFPVVLGLDTRGWSPLLLWPLWLGVLTMALAPTLTMCVAQREAGQPWWRVPLMLPYLLCLGTGLALSNTKAVLEALLGVQSAFVRTPKEGQTGRSRSTRYRARRTWLPFMEIAIGLYCLAALILLDQADKLGGGLFLLIYASGFLYVGCLSLSEAWPFRRYPNAPATAA